MGIFQFYLKTYFTFYGSLAGLLYVLQRFGYKYLQRRKVKVKSNINKADDLFTKFASMILSVNEVIALENDALAYLEGSSQQQI